MEEIRVFRELGKTFRSELMSKAITLKQYNAKYQSALAKAVESSKLTTSQFISSLLLTY
jgi:hypothetical protein